ncbi:MAG: hypothetical protein WA634_16615 [Silvibacterium sp.]
MQKKRLLRMGFLALTFAAVTAAAQLRYVAMEPIVLRDGAGSAAFTLANAGTKPLPLDLRIGPFNDDTSQITLPESRVTFTLEAGGPLPAVIAPGTTVQVQAHVNSMSGTAAASASLFNGNDDLGKLQVVEVDAPLDISISGQGGSGQPLVLAHGDSTSLTIKNNDEEAYPLDWSFQIRGKELQSGELQLAPHGTSRIDLMPTDDLYSWTDNLRPSNKTGQLLLSLHGPPEVARELLPQRTLPVSLLLRKLGPTWTSLWLHLFVALVLLLGGLLSLIGHSVLPNFLRKITLRRQINELADPVSSVSPRVDSYVRVLLRIERKRFDLMLKRSWAISPTTGETLDMVSAAIARVKGRLKVAERLDELQRRLDEASISAPPSVTDGIDGKLQMAAAQLHSLALTDEDANIANRFLDSADRSLTMLGDTDTLARLIATNFRDLKIRQKFLPYSYYNDLKAELPGLFEMLNQPFDDFRNIPRQMIFAIDYGVAALQNAFDYAVLRASTSPAATASGPSARERLISHQKDLVALLGTLSWPALRELRTLVQEMRENIYQKDVLDEIGTPGQAEIALDPQTVRAYMPVLFSIRFKDSRFNDAAAIRCLTCKWDFPKELQEQDWKTCHFFTGSELKRGEGRDLTVSVRVESQKPAEAGAPIDGKAAGRPLRNTLSTMIDLHRAERPSYSRAFAEAVRFFIAFGVALAGLLSGALQQLQRLDFLPATIAILALGFGADTVKNLLTQTSKKTSA